MIYVGLAAIGLVVGCLGTLIGAGGGFLLMPILVLMYPHEEPEVLASISLAVVLCNAASGAFAYVRQRKVDIRAGLWFSAAAAPASVLGAMAVTRIDRGAFELILGVVLMGSAVFLLVSRRGKAKAKEEARTAAADADAMGPRVPHRRGLGMAISAVVGFISSLLGIGGGIIHVPALVQVLGFPVHVATATSHFVLATTAGAGTAAHLLSGAFHVGWRRTAALGIGALIGAQVGARLAGKTKPVVILRVLAVALLLVGVRILVQAARVVWS